MIRWGEIKKGDTLVFIGNGTEIEIGEILGDLIDDRLVYYCGSDGVSHGVHFSFLENEYKVIHNDKKVKKNPASVIRQFNNRVCIMRRLNRIQ